MYNIKLMLFIVKNSVYFIKPGGFISNSVRKEDTAKNPCY